MPIRKYLGRIEPVSLKRTDGSIAVVFAEVFASDDRLVIEVGNTDGEMSIPQHQVRKLARYTQDVLDGIARFRVGDRVESDDGVEGPITRIQRGPVTGDMTVIIAADGQEHTRAISSVHLVAPAPEAETEAV